MYSWYIHLKVYQSVILHILLAIFASDIELLEGCDSQVFFKGSLKLKILTPFKRFPKKHVDL